MRKHWYLNIFMLLLLSFGVESSLAQGLIVSKKDGTKIKVPYELLERVTVYDADQPNPGDSVLPVHFKKKLMRYCERFENADVLWSDTLSFNYDEQGRVLSERYTSSEQHLSSSSYSWKGNQIDYVSHDMSDLEDGTYTIENGKLVSYKGPYVDIVYTYNELGQLISYQDNDEYEGCEYNLSWEGDKLVGFTVQYIDDIEKTVYSIEYTDKKCEGVCLPLYNPFRFSKSFLLVNPCFMGQKINQLPSKMTYKDGKGNSGETNFTFELDNDGFVTKADLIEEYSLVNSDGSIRHKGSHSVFEYLWE